MGKNLIVVGFTIAVTFLCFHYAQSIQCYECNSHWQPACGNSSTIVTGFTVVDCQRNASRCRKIIQWIDFEEDGMGPDQRVIRQCGHDFGEEKPYLYRVGIGGTREEVYTCYTDGCNEASSLILSKALILVAFVVGVLFTQRKLV